DAGTQLWSTTYDRVLADLFSVQTDIARQVVGELDLTLFPAQERGLEEPPTENLEAYQAYLAASALAGDYSDAESQEEVIRLLERAVDLDPGFTGAWAQMAWTHAQIFHFGLDRTEARVEQSRRALDEARRLDPSAPEVHLTEGYFHYWTRQDHAAALRALRLAARGLPGDVRIPETEGYVLRRQGRYGEALARLQAARDLDPLDSNLHREIGSTLTFLRRYDDALASYQRAKETTSEPLLAYLYEMRVHWLRGDLAAARATFEAAPQEPSNVLPTWFGFWQELYEGDLDGALELLEASPEPFVRWTTQAVPVVFLEAEVHRLRGDEARARDAYAEALSAIDAARAATPDDRRLDGSRALALAGLGRGEEARRAADGAVEAVPFDVDAVFHLDRVLDRADVERLLGDGSEAARRVSELVEQPSMLSRALFELDPRWRAVVAPSVDDAQSAP
ncbi:MAG: tetratricopeptide repeat protein, partial [Acidobacteriota bacterium]